MNASAFPPDHIPQELVWDHSYAEFTQELDDPFVAAGRLHDGPPLIWSRDAGLGFQGWIATRNEVFRDALSDPEVFSSHRGNYPLSDLLGFDLKLTPIEYDPPQHTLYRRVLNPYFSPGALKRLDSEVHETCLSLVREFEDRGSCEFVGEFSSKFPAYVFLSLMGMPRELAPQFLEWERGLLHSADHAVRSAAARAIYQYIRGFADEQRSNPTTDLMRGIFSAEIEGRPLTENEILGMIFVLYIGGLDTVNSTVGWIFRHLARDHALQDRLREHPEDIPLAVEEFTRAFSVASATRSVTRDIEFHGTSLRKGDSVVFSMTLATRDPRAYPDPHRIDIDRKRGQNLNFASGPHTCLGMHLARREIRIVLEALLPRLRNLRVSNGASSGFVSGLGFGLKSLPLAWDPRDGGNP